MHDGQNAKKKKIGRPHVITSEKVRELKIAFCFGCSDEEACQFAGVKSSTFYDFCKAHPEFSEQKELWKRNPVLRAKKLIYDSLEYDLKTARWYLERKCKDEFSLREDGVTAGTEDTRQAYLQALRDLSGAQGTTVNAD